jgi:hypothetical protein
MREGIITTRTIRATADNRAVEVIASLDAGEVVPGMFVHIPLNMLDFTIPVASVAPAPDGCIRLVLDCGDEEDGADLVMMFNFEDETLWVLETGEA